MPDERINSDWYTLNRIVRELVREIDRPEGINWANVYTLSQDLMAVSRQAMLQNESDNPPSQP
jgi:hypothetical protein